MDVNAILLKPLDGQAVGSPRVLDEADFKRLESMGAVRRATDEDPLPDEASGEDRLLERLRHPVDGPAMVADLKRLHDGWEKDRAEMNETIATLRTEADAASVRQKELQDEVRTARTDLDVANGRIAAFEDAARKRGAAGEGGGADGKMLTAPANKMVTPPTNKTKG